ncbi:hypothetical protein L2E82_16489 [Cichorium intybus]|uniref:Uncharacterized protein n=1 Tax=Cichorium intybus TaxID=13427 RepID=A0ACB9F663_CICIN|nr:hypothetical protein L2E82_16489 [Cichorium intybus]
MSSTACSSLQWRDEVSSSKYLQTSRGFPYRTWNSPKCLIARQIDCFCHGRHNLDALPILHCCRFPLGSISFVDLVNWLPLKCRQVIIDSRNSFKIGVTFNVISDQLAPLLQLQLKKEFAVVVEEGGIATPHRRHHPPSRLQPALNCSIERSLPCLSLPRMDTVGFRWSFNRSWNCPIEPEINAKLRGRMFANCGQGHKMEPAFAENKEVIAFQFTIKLLQ